MNEIVTKRLAALAAARARDIAAALAETAEAEMPAGVTVERHEDGVVLAGRRLLQRLAFAPGLDGVLDRVRP